MKVLWIVNTIFPYPAKQLGMEENVFGGWLNGLAGELRNNENIKLAIATVYNGNELKEFNDGKVIYYLLPGAPAIKYNKKLEEHWQKVNNKFKPDLVHIHGTEYAHGLAFQKACPNIKAIVSVQGLVSVYSNEYYANISVKEILKNITFRDIVKRDTIIQARKKYEKRGKIEREIIKNAKAVLGRTTWDYANVKAIKPDATYFTSNEILRNSFYENVWNIENIKKYTIFMSQGSYPIKCLHYAIKAIYILKKNYPNVKLYIAGTNIIKRDTLKQKIKFSGYAKYISKLIKKYNVEENIIFTGLLNEKEMVKQLLKSHVFILPSAIENSANSLGEAMILGMPCVASNVGGTMDMLEHKKEGFLYPYTEPAMLATYISRFFEDDKLCEEYGKNAKEKALIKYSQKENANCVIKIYEKMKEI